MFVDSQIMQLHRHWIDVRDFNQQIQRVFRVTILKT